MATVKAAPAAKSAAANNARTKSSLIYRDGFWAAIMLAPNLIGFLMFTLIPVIASFFLSFTSYDIITPMKFIGLNNYKEMIGDPIVAKILWNTIFYTIVTVPVGITISLGLAIAMNQKIKGITAFRAIYFMPVISSMVAVAMVWQWLYNPEFGLLNTLLKLIGIRGPNWLSDTTWALPSVMITAVWKNLGYNMMLFLAGLQGIGQDYYEAATIDGANKWQQFRFITWPLLSPTTFFVTIMSLIGSFQVFDLVMLMTKGGPNRASSVLVHYIYENAFQFYRMGYASAVAYLLFACVLITSIFNLRMQKKTSIY